MTGVTDVLRLDPQHPDRSVIARAATVLRAGGLVAFPTETVYGLGAHALDRSAVRRIFDAKGRPATDPLIIHVNSVEGLRPLVSEVPDIVRTLAAEFWPGPLTLVLPRSPAVPDEVTAGLATVAVRIPAHPVARALIEAAALPVAAPSANLFSRPSPTRAEHVVQDLDGRIDLIIDAGPTTVGVESTVLQLTTTPPVILRPGAVTIEMLRRVLPDVRLHGAQVAAPNAPMASPGLLEKHYSPRAPLTLYEGAPAAIVARIAADAHAALRTGERIGIVAADEDPFEQDERLHIARVGRASDLGTVAANLYAALRELDSAGVDRIFARSFPAESGIGVAIVDRLRRASAGRIVRA